VSDHHLVELQRKLQESRNEIPPISKYRIRTAAVDDANKLLRIGWKPHTTAEVLGIPLSEVQTEKARKYSAKIF
jgi:hypothetical protein